MGFVCTSIVTVAAVYALANNGNHPMRTLLSYVTAFSVVFCLDCLLSLYFSRSKPKKVIWL
jgi:hypothetical protein